MNLLDVMLGVSLEEVNEPTTSIFNPETFNTIYESVKNETNKDDGVLYINDPVNEEIVAETDVDLVEASDQITRFNDNTRDAEEDLQQLEDVALRTAIALQDPNYTGMDDVSVETLRSSISHINSKYGLGFNLDQFGTSLESFSSLDRREATIIALEGLTDLLSRMGDRISSAAKQGLDILAKKTTLDLSSYNGLKKDIDKMISNVEESDGDYGGNVIPSNHLMQKMFQGGEVNSKLVHTYINRHKSMIEEVRVIFKTIEEVMVDLEKKSNMIGKKGAEDKDALIKSLASKTKREVFTLGDKNEPLVGGRYAEFIIKFNTPKNKPDVRFENQKTNFSINRSIKLETANKKELLGLLKELKSLIEATGDLNGYISSVARKVRKLQTFKLDAGTTVIVVDRNATLQEHIINVLVIFIGWLIRRLLSTLTSVTAESTLLNVTLARNVFRFANTSMGK